MVPAQRAADRPAARRRRLGAWYTPPDLIELVIDGLLDDLVADPNRTPPRSITILDPACGDGRFLVALAGRLAALGMTVEATGCDIDDDAVAATPAVIGGRPTRRIRADALDHDWADERFDIVIGNPPFLSQMAADTSRGGASRHGGGPYADAAVEFLSLAVRLARPDGGRVALVLPQSILGARDAGPVRAEVDRTAELVWSWWEPSQQHFDAAVNVCVLGLRRPATGSSPGPWTRVVTDRLGVPSVDRDRLGVDGTVADRAELNANFRDEYYALVPAVSDDAHGPPLVTSGLIDPGVCHWGDRSVRFAKRRFEHPRVDLDLLTGRFPAWARRKLVPKVLVANQTKIIEAVADPDGAWLPGVPVTTVTPTDARTDPWEIAAVLTSPVASALAWSSAAGTGMSTGTVRISPAAIGAVPWPGGDVNDAVDALRHGEVATCGRAITAAYGVDDDALTQWWVERLPGPA